MAGERLEMLSHSSSHLFLPATIPGMWQLQHRRKKSQEAAKTTNFSVMSHIQTWTLSLFRSLLSLVHGAHGSYLMWANHWHSHILWVVADDCEQPHSQHSGSDFPFPSPPAPVRTQTQLLGALSWPTGCRHLGLLTPCYQPRPTHVGILGAHSVVVPEGARTEVPADIQSNCD